MRGRPMSFGMNLDPRIGKLTRRRKLAIQLIVNVIGFSTPFELKHPIIAASVQTVDQVLFAKIFRRNRSAPANQGPAEHRARFDLRLVRRGMDGSGENREKRRLSEDRIDGERATGDATRTRGVF